MVGFREATPADLVALGELERRANLVGLGHVFDPRRHPFPVEDVLARWALVLEEPGSTVLVVDSRGGDGLDAYAAYDERSLRLLAVDPDRWGQGLASAAVEHVVTALAARGTETAELWCLELNHRARRLYEHLGWRASADRRESPWPPHPTEMRFTRALRASA